MYIARYRNLQDFQSSSGEFWVASRMNGLYRIKADDKIIEETISPSRVVSPQIREFVEDNRKRIWFGTFDGLQMYDPEKDEYKVYRAENIAGTLEHNSVFFLFIKTFRIPFGWEVTMEESTISILSSIFFLLS